MGGEELPEGVRLRIALDVLGQLAMESAQPIGARAAKSRLRLGNVTVLADGSAELRGTGDSSGAPTLLWEILASREAGAGELPRVHDVVDELHPDVDDVVTNALERRYATLDELVEALGDAAGERVATYVDVARAVQTPSETTPAALATGPTDGAPSDAPPTEPSPVADVATAAAEVATDEDWVAPPPRHSETRLAAKHEPPAEPAADAREEREEPVAAPSGET